MRFKSGKKFWILLLCTCLILENAGISAQASELVPVEQEEETPLPKEETPEEEAPLPKEEAPEEELPDEETPLPEGEDSEEAIPEETEEAYVEIEEMLEGPAIQQETASYFYEPTQREIAAKWKELNLNLSMKNSYAKSPNAVDGGRLSDASLQNALNIINFVRYTAGVASDVQLYEPCNYEAQCASYVMWKNNKMTHYPVRPEEVSDELWEAGRTGASRSNIAAGWSSSGDNGWGLPYHILNGWVKDSDSSNIDRVGHRIHILKPEFSVTGFGAMGANSSNWSYCAMHTIGYKREGNFSGDYICWPAKNMPYELYKTSNSSPYAFSVGLGPDYDLPLLDDLTVTVHSQKRNTSWVLTSASADKTGEYLNVSNISYSLEMRNWIIFNVLPAGQEFAKGDTVSVKIEGLTKDGEACAPIEYEVKFFSASDFQPKAEMIAVSSQDDKDTLRENKQLQFFAEVLPGDTANKAVTWSVESLDENGTGTINSSGLFTAKTAGSVKIIAAAKDGSGVKGEKCITILPAKIPVLTLNFSETETDYTGSRIDFDGMKELSAEWPDEENNEIVPVDVSGAEVTYYSDMACTRKVTSIVEAGSYWAKAVLKGLDEYEDCEAIVKLTVRPVSMEADGIKVEGLKETGYAYTGKAIKPTVTVTYRGTALKLNTDYTVAYEDNTQIGTAAITITGKGNFTGSCSRKFEITRIIMGTEEKEATDFVIGNIPAATYNGNAHTPTVSVKYKGMVLKKDKDYTLTYTNNKDAGTAFVTITGIGLYDGFVVKTFTIKSMGIEKLIVPQVEAQEYCAEKVTPAFGEVSVKIGKDVVSLVQERDYKINYMDSFDAGTGKMIFAGTGNYTGMYVKTYPIKAKPLNEEEFETSLLFNGVEGISAAYTGKAIKPDVDVTYVKNERDTVALEAGKDYTLSYSKNTARGTAAVIIKGKGNYSGSLKREFTIEKASLDGAAIEVSDMAYTGKQVKPSVKVTDAAGNAVKASEYTVSYVNNTEMSTGKEQDQLPLVTITAKEKGNYTGSASEYFRIGLKLSAAEVSGIPSKAVYTGEEIRPEVTLTVKQGKEKIPVNPEEYDVEYSGNSSKGKATVIITARKDGNYVGTITKTFSITAKPLSEQMAGEITAVTYNGKAQKPPVTLMDGEKTLLLNRDYTVAYSSNTNAGTATAAITGKGNYSGTVKVRFTILPLELSSAVAEVADLAYHASKSGKPKVTVKTADGLVLPTSAYTVVYGNYAGETGLQVNTITVSAKGSNTKGSNTTNRFYIGIDLKAAKIGSIPAKIYSVNGAEAAASEIQVNLGNERLDAECYQVSYEKNLAAGTARLIVTGVPEKGYIGQVAKNFTIQAKPLSDSNIRVECTDSMVYSGKKLTPEVKVYDGETLLTPKVDYTVSYTNNTKIGTAGITISGKKNYKGKIQKNFQIVVKEIS